MEAASHKTLSITIAMAPRTMDHHGQLVKAGSVIALREGQIIAFGERDIDVACDSIADSISDSTELITLVTGANARDELVEEVINRINQEFPYVEVTAYSGGQAWYPLLIGIE